MATISFDELVRQEQQALKSASAEPFDPFGERDEWLGRLDELYRQVGGFLADYIRSEGVKVDFQPIRIEEEQVGSYTAQEMVIGIGRKTVRLEPIGTFLIGTKGRVDVIGPRERGRIVLLNKSIKRVSQLVRVTVSLDGNLPAPPPLTPASEIEWSWKIMGRPPRMEISELTQETFLALLAEVANG